MHATCKSPTVCLFFAVSSFVGAIVAIVFCEFGLPTIMRNAANSAAVIDTEAKFNASLGKLVRSEKRYSFFNLTNAHALQTETPRPEPIFQEVVITLDVQAKAFDFELSADGTSYTMCHWTYATPKTASDAQLEIVQVNSFLTTAILYLGGEAALQQTYYAVTAMAANLNIVLSPLDPTTYGTACGYVLAATGSVTAAAVEGCTQRTMVYGALLGETRLPLRPDGTRPTNMGLFTRHTIGELFNGYTDPMTLQWVLGSFANYNLYNTSEALQAALASGVETADKWQLSLKTGRGNADAGTWHAFRGITEFSPTAATNMTLPLWMPRTAGYDNNGDITDPTRSGYNIEGMRTVDQPMSAIENTPSVLVAGFPPKASPTAGNHMAAFDPMLLRQITYSCGSCRRELLQDLVHVVKYQMDESNGWLKTRGERDVAGACAIGTGQLSNMTIDMLTMSPTPTAITATPCDFGLRVPATWSNYEVARPHVTSLPYYGESSPTLIASATFQDMSGAHLAYDSGAVSHYEVSVEPFTGLAFKKNMHFQINLDDKTSPNARVFNGVLYSNVFSKPVPLYWPLHTVKVDSELPGWRTIAHSLRSSYLMMIGLYAYAANCILSGLFFLYSMRKVSRVCPPSSSQSIKSKDSKLAEERCAA